MIFGFNTDVLSGNATYHVQTEDRGAKNPVVDSIIYVGGKIVDRIRTPYDPETVTDSQIDSMVRNQHRDLVESIRTGTFSPSPSQPVSSEAAPPPTGYGVKLVNPTAIATNGELCFEFCVWDRAKASPAQDVSLDLRWTPTDGATETMSLSPGEDGKVVVRLPIPENSEDISLLLCAAGPEGREFLKFRVRRETGVGSKD